MHPVLEHQVQVIFGGWDRVPAGLNGQLREISDAYYAEDRGRSAPGSEVQSSVLHRITDRLLQEIAAQRKEGESQTVSEQRYRALTELSPAGIFHADADGQTVYVNKAWTEITGPNPRTGDGRQLAAGHPPL